MGQDLSPGVIDPSSIIIDLGMIYDKRVYLRLRLSLALTLIALFRRIERLGEYKEIAGLIAHNPESHTSRANERPRARASCRAIRGGEEEGEFQKGRKVGVEWAEVYQDRYKND